MKKKGLSAVFYLALMLFAFSSCNKEWKSYIVKAGNHSCNGLSAPVINVNEIEFLVKANSSWYYNAPEKHGWNKIRGLSHGHHQENSSVRLGYQCFNDTMLVVGAYCYVDGVSPQENPAQKGIIDTIQPGKAYRCVIRRQYNKYIIEFEDKKWEGPAGREMNWGYILNPYVGGEFTFDHDWLVEIKEPKK